MTFTVFNATLIRVSYWQIHLTLEELDPVAFSRGLSDYNTGDFFELYGDYYLSHEVEELREQIEDSLEENKEAENDSV